MPWGRVWECALGKSVRYALECALGKSVRVCTRVHWGRVRVCTERVCTGEECESVH